MKRGVLYSVILTLALSIMLPFNISADSGFDYDNYYELNYIESNGNQYINTNISYTSSLSIEMSATILSSGTYALFGSTNPQNTFSVWFGSYQGKYGGTPGGNLVTSNISVDSNFHKFEFIGNVFKLDDNTIGTGGNNYPNQTILLFRRYTPNATTTPPLNGSFRISYFNVYDNGTLSANFVAAERKSDNVLGMYDTVSNTFYPNDGSGSFVSGGRKPISFTLTLSVSPEGSGSVLNGGIYEYGDVVQIGAIPNNGYEFNSWSDNNTDNPRTLTITGNLSLTASFVQSSGGGGGGADPTPDPDPGPPVGDYYTISGSAYPSGSGTVIGLGRYSSGTVVTISASANQGYHFNSWSDGSTQNPRTYTVNSNINVIANFDYDNSTVSSNPIIGINANVIGIDTYGDSITLPRITYIPNSTQGVIDGYLVSTNSSNSVYDLGNSPSVSGASSGLTVTFNVGGYLTSNSNININNLTKVLTEYEFILDNYYRGTVIISDGINQYTRYVNGNRFVFNSSSSDLSVQSFTVVSYSLEQNAAANNIDILTNGTNDSNNASSNLNSTTSDLDDSVNDLVTAEDEFNDNLNEALQDIDINNNIPSAMGSKFLASADWVRVQFNRMTNNTPFGSVLGFSLVLGISLLIIGKVFK